MLIHKKHFLLCFVGPYNVTDLQAETLNTTAIRLVWMKPLEYKVDYTYQVKTTVCGNKNKTLAEEGTEISELTPGTACTFCVFVKAKDGIEGKASCISQYTSKSLTCHFCLFISNCKSDQL